MTMTSTPVRLLALVLLLVSSSPLHADPKAETSDQVTMIAKRFMRAFETREFDKAQAFFAPDAHVSRVSVTDKKPARYQTLTAEAWIETTRREHEKLSNIQLDIHETKALMLDFAAAVNILYTFRCNVGERTFVSEGIDTYQMVQVDGEWKIKHYTYIDRLSMASTHSQ